MRRHVRLEVVALIELLATHAACVARARVAVRGHASPVIRVRLYRRLAVVVLEVGLRSEVLVAKLTRPLVLSLSVLCVRSYVLFIALLAVEAAAALLTRVAEGLHGQVDLVVLAVFSVRALGRDVLLKLLGQLVDAVRELG